MVMGMVVVGIIVVRMAVIMFGSPFAKPTTGSGMVVCRASSSVLRTHTQSEEWDTDGGLSALE